MQVLFKARLVLLQRIKVVEQLTSPARTACACHPGGVAMVMMIAVMGATRRDAVSSEFRLSFVLNMFF